MILAVKLNSSGSYVIFTQAFCFHESYRILEQHPQTPPPHWQGPCLIAVTVLFSDSEEFEVCLNSCFRSSCCDLENSSGSLLTVVPIVKPSSTLDSRRELDCARTVINSTQQAALILRSCPAVQTKQEDISLRCASLLRDWNLTGRLTDISYWPSFAVKFRLGSLASILWLTRTCHGETTGLHRYLHISNISNR